MANILKVIFGLIAVVGVIAVGAALWGIQEVNRHQAMSPEEHAAEEAETRAKQDVFSRQRRVDNKDGQLCLNFSGMNTDTVEQLKERLRDPNSFQHISTRIAMVDGNGVHRLVMRYRAKNGFGGTSFGITIANVSNLDCSATISSNLSQ